MTKLTVKALESIGPERVGQKLRDGGGLVGIIRSRADGVSVKWDWRYRYGGKVRQITVGTWPKSSLADIRKERDRLESILSEGKDPATEKQTVRLQQQADQIERIAHEQSRIDEAAERQARLTVENLFQKWERVELSGRKDAGKEVHRAFNKDVLPEIGKLAAEDVRRQQIATLLDKVVERGSRIVARNLLGHCRRAFKTTQLCALNFTQGL